MLLYSRKISTVRDRPNGLAPKGESRGVGTPRLPYVGDRVGGLGVRPPALPSYMASKGALRQGAPCPVGPTFGSVRPPQWNQWSAAARRGCSPTLATASPGQAIEHRKPPLLVLVQALIERIGGFRQLLQGRPGIGHGCGPLTQALDRVVGRRRRSAHRAHAVEAEACRARARPARRPASSFPDRE